MKPETINRNLRRIISRRQLSRSELARMLRIRRRIVDKVLRGEYELLTQEETERVTSALKAIRHDPLYRVVSMAKQMRADGATDAEIEAAARQLLSLIHLVPESSGPQGTASGAQSGAS